MYCCFCS
ncbi:hypothetical protein LINGRAHAP2_LOCUS8781 [Linum grandiflorum]